MIKEHVMVAEKNLDFSKCVCLLRSLKLNEYLKTIPYMYKNLNV